MVGGGPAGLEAARVCALRGHDVVLFEAEQRLGGQVNIASLATWRKSLSAIIRWYDTQFADLEIDLRLGSHADVEMVLAEKPDVVVVATGGRAAQPHFEGAEFCVTIPEVLTGARSVSGNVLIFDDNGSHHAMSCAEVLTRKGCKVEIVTPDRFVGPEIGGFNYPVHLRELYKANVVFSPDLRLVRIYREGNQLIPVLQNDYTLEEEERAVDAVIFEHGTSANDELYFSLKPHSRNLGEIDPRKMIAIQPQDGPVKNSAGEFFLMRVGDAVSSRNIHAAMFDSNRLCRVL